MSDRNVYCSTTHTGENHSIALYLTPSLFYYESAERVYSTEREEWSLSNSTIEEIRHILCNQSSMQPVALHRVENHLLDCCILTHDLVTRPS